MLGNPTLSAAPALLLPLSLKLLLPSWDRTSAEYIPITMTITIMNHPPRVPNNDHTEVGSCNSLLPAFSFLPFATACHLFTAAQTFAHAT